MPGEINCVFTKGLIPFVEKEVGPEGVAAICRVAGRSRDYLMADHNWIPVGVADEMVRVCQQLMNEPDEERWARRYGEYFMDWKPREERSYLGTYSMGIGHPRGAYQRLATLYGQQSRSCRLDVLEVGRRRARYRWTPLPGHRVPLWTCTWLRVQLERYPTNWGLPRARVIESACAARGDEACRWEVHWKNPSLGAHFWWPSLAGAAGVGRRSPPWPARPAPAGRSWPRPRCRCSRGWRSATRCARAGGAGTASGSLDLQSEEIIYSNRELEKKFAELETRIEQLSLLTDLSAAVSATLDPEKIYDQTLTRLVHRMGYRNAYLSLVDRRLDVLRGHRKAGADTGGPVFEGVEQPLDTAANASAPGGADRPAGARRGRGPRQPAGPSGPGAGARDPELHRRAAAGARAGLRGAHRHLGRAGGLRPG